MKLKLSFSDDLLILLRLYKIKKGTLIDISNAIGKSHHSGKIYAIKDDLLKLKILIPTEELKTIKSGRGERLAIVFKINHKILDQLFCGELKTSIIYNRIVDGHTTVTLPRIKRKGILEDL